MTILNILQGIEIFVKRYTIERDAIGKMIQARVKIYIYWFLLQAKIFNLVKNVHWSICNLLLILLYSFIECVSIHNLFVKSKHSVMTKSFESIDEK